jgi:hypothetical protein
MYRMRAAAVAMGIALALICIWWTVDYVRRRGRARRRR